MITKKMKDLHDREKKTVLVQTKIAPSLRDSVSELLKEQNLTWNNLIEAAAIQFLEENAKKKRPA